MTIISNLKAYLCSTLGKCTLAFTTLTIVGIIISSIIGHLNKTMNEYPRVIQGAVLNWNITMDGVTNSYEFEPYFKNGSDLFFDNFLNQIE